MLALGRQADIFKRNTRWHFFYLERLTGRIFGLWSAGTAWRVLHVLEALAFSQGSLSPVLNISVHFCAGMLPQSKPLVHKSPVPVQNELWSSCSTIRASSSLYYSLAFLHQWEGSQASMSRSCMQSLSSCPAHIKNLHILLIFPNISWKQLLFLIFNNFLKQHKSHRVAAFVQICYVNCVCIFNSNLIWHSTWKLGSNEEKWTYCAFCCKKNWKHCQVVFI